MAELSTPSLPADHFIKIHQFTPTTHRDVYPSIDPLNSLLSQKGKTVIITGASQGIGRAIAIAFAKADAARIVLASRSIVKLEATKKELLNINDKVEVLVVSTDTTSEKSVNHLEAAVKEKFGTPDVLVNAAGLWSSTEVLSESKPEAWWADFEVNLKGTYLMIRSFLRLVGSDKEAVILNVGTWGMLMTASTGTSYSISKLAVARLSEAIPLGYPNVRSVNYHPGMVKTEMADSHPEVLSFCGDTVELAAGTAVYLASPQADFLSGRYMSANWDVNELVAKKDNIIEDDLLKLDLKGSFGSSLFSSAAEPSSKRVSSSFYTTVLYPATEGMVFNISHFTETHMPLALKHWSKYGLKGYEITHFEDDIVGNPKLLYSVQCILEWDGPEGLGRAISGDDRDIVFDDVPNFTNVQGVFMTGRIVASG